MWVLLTGGLGIYLWRNKRFLIFRIWIILLGGLILFETAMIVAMLFWKSDVERLISRLNNDDLDDYDRVSDRIRENLEIVRWVALGYFLFQLLVLVLTFSRSRSLIVRNRARHVNSTSGYRRLSGSYRDLKQEQDIGYSSKYGPHTSQLPRETPKTDARRAEFAAKYGVGARRQDYHIV